MKVELVDHRGLDFSYKATADDGRFLFHTVRMTVQRPENERRAREYVTALAERRFEIGVDVYGA